MKRRRQGPVVAIVVALAVAAAVAYAGADGGARTTAGVSVFALCAALAFAINWIAFVPAYLARSERYYDLVGSLTYVALVVTALTLGGGDPARSSLLATLILVWAARLGSYLFRRIRDSGGDGRFDRIKSDPAAFAVAWTLQGLWVFLTAGCALAAMTSSPGVPTGPVEALGVVVWAGGFAVEVVADRQKAAFRRDPAARGRFIDRGLWAWSRHPNYFGEIVLWTGVAIVAAPALAGWQYVTLVSPAFVALLLLRISGVPLLEARADEKWRGDPDYEAYKARTPVLVPRPPDRR